VPKRNVAPIAQLLLGLDSPVHLNLHKGKGSQHSELVLELQGPQAGGRVGRRK
jgi:hypothetical protein